MFTQNTSTGLQQRNSLPQPLLQSMSQPMSQPMSQQPYNYSVALPNFLGRYDVTVPMQQYHPMGVGGHTHVQPPSYANPPTNPHRMAANASIHMTGQEESYSSLPLDCDPLSLHLPHRNLLRVSSDTNIAKQPPQAPLQKPPPNDLRSEAYNKLSKAFNHELVREVMQAHPNETDSKALAKLIMEEVANQM